VKQKQRYGNCALHIGKAWRNRHERISGCLVREGDHDGLLLALQQYPPGTRRESFPAGIRVIDEGGYRIVGLELERRVVREHSNANDVRPEALVERPQRFYCLPAGQRLRSDGFERLAEYSLGEGLEQIEVVH